MATPATAARQTRDQSYLDDQIGKISRLLRRRYGQHAFTEITVIVQDGVPLRVKELRQQVLEELVPEQW